MDPLSVGTQDDSLQPWQLTALQESVDFSDSPTEAADRCREVTTILSGLLEIDDNKRWTAEQLASCSWLSEAASGQISPSPLQLR